MRKQGLYTRDQVVESLRLAKGMKSQVSFAEELKISPQLLNDVLLKRRHVPEEALDFLGLEDAGRLYRRKAKGGK